MNTLTLPGVPGILRTGVVRARGPSRAGDRSTHNPKLFDVVLRVEGGGQ